MHEVLVNRLGGLSLPRKSVARLTDRPDMTLDVYRGRKTTLQQQQIILIFWLKVIPLSVDLKTDSDIIEHSIILRAIEKENKDARARTHTYMYTYPPKVTHLI